MPVVFNNPNFDQMIIDNEEEDENFVAPENFITPIAKPNITASNQNLMTTGVQSGPYRGMYDYLETYPNNAGLTAADHNFVSDLRMAELEMMIWYHKLLIIGEKTIKRTNYGNFKKHDGKTT